MLQNEIYWTNKIHNEIPLTHAMGLTINRLDESQIQLTGLLEKNINGHKTAFAGSIYTIAITTGWTFLSHFNEQKGWNASVVAGSANVKYKQPLSSDLYARCTFDLPCSSKKWLDSWDNNKNARQALKIEVGSEKQTTAIINAQFFLLKS